jgi:predicted transport protein
MKISKDAKEMDVVDTGGSGYKLTQDVNGIGNVRTSDVEIDITTDKEMSRGTPSMAQIRV